MAFGHASISMLADSRARTGVSGTPSGCVRLMRLFPGVSRNRPPANLWQPSGLWNFAYPVEIGVPEAVQPGRLKNISRGSIQRDPRTAPVGVLHPAGVTESVNATPNPTK